MQVVGGMIPDQIDDGRTGAPGVMEVGEPVTDASAQVKKRQRRFVGHACIAIRCTGHDPFEQPQDRAHVGLAVDCGDQLHLGRAGIGETHFDPRRGERADKSLRPVDGTAIIIGIEHHASSSCRLDP